MLLSASVCSYAFVYVFFLFGLSCLCPASHALYLTFALRVPPSRHNNAPFAEPSQPHLVCQHSVVKNHARLRFTYSSDARIPSWATMRIQFVQSLWSYLINSLNSRASIGSIEPLQEQLQKSVTCASIDLSGKSITDKQPRAQRSNTATHLEPRDIVRHRV